MTVNLVSIIIPSRKRDDLKGLLEDISKQKTSFKTEILRITEISPPGKARNTGAKQAKGEILAFVDSDVRLGNDFYISNLVKVLEEDKKIGAACASLRLPPEASRFQLRYAREVAHCETPIVDTPTEVYVVPSACFAIYRDLFFKVDKFNEQLIRGEDSEFTERLQAAGYRLILTPQTWCYHPSPDNLWQLVRTNLRNGAGVCFVDTFYPQLNLDVHPKGIIYFSGQKTMMERIKRFLVSSCQAIVKMQFLLIIAKIFYAIGYLYGYFKYRVLKYNVKKVLIF